MIKCFKCGTQYIAGECPTCAQKRLSEERNRLANEQNEHLKRQTTELERQNRNQEKEYEENKSKQREHEYRQADREYKKILKEQFNSKLEEFLEYSIERKQILVNAYFPSSKLNDFCNSIEATISNEGIYVSADDFKKAIIEKCLIELNELEISLKKDDRLINADDYSVSFSPEFKLGALKESINKQTSKYITYKNDNEYNIFPKDLIENNDSLNGYEGKKISIGKFNYIMFLKDKEEVKKVSEILSISHNRLENVIKKIEKSILDYHKSNPKPNEYKPIYYKHSHTNVSSTTVLICIIIGVVFAAFGFFGLPLIIDNFTYGFFKEFNRFYFSLASAGICFLIGAFAIGRKLSESYKYRQISKFDKKNDKARNLYQDDLEKRKENFKIFINDLVKDLKP